MNAVKRNSKEEKPRVRVTKTDSRYLGDMGYILFSNCDGTFMVQVAAEGDPTISLKPSEVEPC